MKRLFLNLRAARILALALTCTAAAATQSACIYNSDGDCGDADFDGLDDCWAEPWC